ncbi:hypothetical protein HJG60_008603 [Phyllostomus discolor]|uniref:Uncharacterized protein n=1 Tax=Phyllostomus discolor TaxID=89673 RepID=A0A833Z1N3_9CHIR|nr:hypothetical protein HJG60_008603 [Phyllostomus discolor]
MRVEDTPENRFLAYLAILSAKSTRTLLLIAIIFCFGGQGLAAKNNAFYIYWGHIIDPPVFKLHTWWNVDPPFSNNDTQWTGGVWMPQDGPLDKNKHWLLLHPANSRTNIGDFQSIKDVALLAKFNLCRGELSKCRETRCPQGLQTRVESCAERLQLSPYIGVLARASVSQKLMWQLAICLQRPHVGTG